MAFTKKTVIGCVAAGVLGVGLFTGVAAASADTLSSADATSSSVVPGGAVTDAAAAAPDETAPSPEASTPAPGTEDDATTDEGDTSGEDGTAESPEGPGQVPGQEAEGQGLRGQGQGGDCGPGDASGEGRPAPVDPATPRSTDGEHPQPGQEDGAAEGSDEGTAS